MYQSPGEKIGNVGETKLKPTLPLLLSMGLVVEAKITIGGINLVTHMGYRGSCPISIAVMPAKCRVANGEVASPGLSI